MKGRVTLQTALGYGAAILGPGLLSGREIWEFFLREGSGGIGSVLLTAALYAVGGALLLAWPRSGPPTLFGAIREQVGARAAHILIWTARSALVLNLAVVLATCAQMGRVGGLPAGASIPLFGLILLVLNRRGIRNLLRLGAVVLPATIALAGAVAWKGMALGPASPPLPGSLWGLKTLFYVGYNLILAMPLLYVMGRREEGKSLWLGGALGGAGLGAVTWFLFESIGRGGGGQCGLPMICAVNRIWPWARMPFTGLLALLLLLSGLSILLALAGLGERREDGGQANALGALLLAWAMTPLGLGAMMNLLYPLFGAGGVAALWLALRARGGGNVGRM